MSIRQCNSNQQQARSLKIKESSDRVFFHRLELNPSRHLNLETRRDRTRWASGDTLFTDNTSRSGKNQHRRFGV